MLVFLALLWSPYLLKEASKGVSTTELLIACCFKYSVESVTAFNILLLIIIETDKNSLAPPRLQNIWELLAVTVVSYLALSARGTLISIGYVVSGRRMWRNLKTSREVGKFLAKGRLNITLLVYLELCITAVLILNIYLAASKYVRYLQIFRNNCEYILELVCNQVSAKELSACHCGFNLCSCHSKKVWKRFGG